MLMPGYFCRGARTLLVALALAGVSVFAPLAPFTSFTPSALAQTPPEAIDFHAALEPFGAWRQHPRWGEVWVPDLRLRDWRPYTYGHWVFTDEWGWFWVSDPEEEEWGWIVYHYGRWVFDRRLGWIWVPGDEWAPAWVDWRYGGEVAGWAPLPPDDVIVEYEAEPIFWTFVQMRYLAAPTVRRFYIPRSRYAGFLRSSVVVNRAYVHGGGRLGINPGISPAYVAAASRSPVPTFRVSPRVFTGTQGVSGAVAVRPGDLRVGRRDGSPGAGRVPPVAVERTTNLIQPAASVPAPQPLGRDERGRLGTHPPRAAQGGGVPSSPPGAGPPSSPPGSGPPPPPPPAANTPASPPAPETPRRDQRVVPPGFSPLKPGESPPQARPLRPPPQIPPPPPSAGSRPKPPPPPAASGPKPPPPPPANAEPKPPPPPAAAAPKPPPPPPPPAANAPRPPPGPPSGAGKPPPGPPPKKPPPKPGEKPEEKSEEKK